MVLEILRDYIVENTDIQANSIYFNYTEAVKDDCVILWHYDGIFTDIGERPQVQIMVKSTNMQLAKSRAYAIYDTIYPVGQFQKVMEIQDKVLFIQPKQSPFYLEKDESNRHIYVFNLDIIKKRS